MLGRLSFVLALIFSFGLVGCSLASSDSGPPSGVSYDEVRTAQVCVLNDGGYPVSESVIYNLTNYSFESFRENVDINFVQSGRVRTLPENAFPRTSSTRTSANFTDWIKAHIKQFCTSESEAAILFSDYKHPKRKGMAAPDLGVAVVYHTDRKKLGHAPLDEGGNPASGTTLNHELGHLFNLEHTRDKRSFMYKGVILNSDWSMGLWTDKTRQVVFENRLKEWKLLRE